MGKIYKRICNGCNNYYKGYGKWYCSISCSLKGREFTEEHKQNLSKARRKWKFSEETKKKISESNKGKKRTKEIRRKLSESHKGQNPWNKGIKGEEFLSYYKNGHPRGMKGKKVSISSRKKMSKAHKGEKSYFWKGGITPINRRIRNGMEIRLWREAVFTRDNWTCQKCSRRSKKGERIILNADHIKSFSLYPELRFEIDNGRTLCEECHRKTKNYGVKIKKII